MAPSRHAALFAIALATPTDAGCASGACDSSEALLIQTRHSTGKSSLLEDLLTTSTNTTSTTTTTSTQELTPAPTPAPTTQAPTPAPTQDTIVLHSHCLVNETVLCPGTNDTWCSGNSCCPGIDDGDNFPCPSASLGWGENKCQHPTKLYDCTASWHCAAGDTVQCPGSGVWCSGESCCPGVDGGDNFPCPSAPNGWGEGMCQNPEKMVDCTPAPQCQEDDHVGCPGSEGNCYGEQCCPGVDGSGDKTFPCPSAPADWGEGACQSTTKLHDCTTGFQCMENETVQCPGSGAWCSGQSCCPGVDGGDNFPCPSAPSGWGSGMCQSTAKRWDCTLWSSLQDSR